MSVDRGFTWMDDETVALIDIYSKDDIQHELSTCKRNISVYERIARELSNVGYRRTAYQCREKIKRLRKEYHLAKYCIEHDIVNKKPMKYFELVDKIFNRDNPEPCNSIDLGLLSSDLEDELHFSFSQDPESDTSNSCSGIESVIPQVILPGPSCSPIHDSESTIASMINSENSPSNTQADCDDSFLLNGEEAYNCSGKDDSESPWVPNVVLVENDLGNSDLDNCSENPDVFNDILHENGTLPNFQSDRREELIFEAVLWLFNQSICQSSSCQTPISDIVAHMREPRMCKSTHQVKWCSEEPPEKRRRPEITHSWFNNMLESVTDTFLKYHEMSECRFLERIANLEQERMKRDEKLQKLWMEFEERRRKEEQQHELKMMSLLGQLVRLISENGNNNSQ